MGQPFMLFARNAVAGRVHSQGWLVLGVLTAATLATFTLLAWRDLEARHAAAARQGNDTTWFIGRSVGDKFRQYDRELGVIAAEVEATGDFNADSVWRLMGLAIQTTPDVRSFGLYDSHGRVVQHSERRGGFPDILVADREYFRRLHDGPGLGTIITRPFASRVHGETIIGLARAIRGSDGSFHGVALAAVSPEAFDLLAGLPNLPRNSAISIHRRDGINLFRAPLLPDQIGRDLSDSPVFATALPSAPTGITMTGPQGSIMDGESRMLAYRALDDWPLVVVVGIPRAEIIAGWRHHWTRNAMLVGLALIGFSWLATIVQRQITGRLEAELSLSRQELQYRAQVEEELRRWATTDALTGMSNRRHFLDLCEREMQRAVRYGRPLTVAIFDVDLFKRINDGFGHATGDEVLRTIAQLTAAALRETDLAGRLGGEEFGLLLPETDLAGGVDMAERLRAAIANAHIEVSGQTVPVTISIGVAALAAEEASVDVLFARADQALYHAKNAGRDRVAVAGPALNERIGPARSESPHPLP